VARKEVVGFVVGPYNTEYVGDGSPVIPATLNSTVIELGPGAMILLGTVGAADGGDASPPGVVSRTKKVPPGPVLNWIASCARLLPALNVYAVLDAEFLGPS